MNISPASTSAEALGKLKRHDLLIGGSISPPVGGEYILTDNPYTGKVWGEIARGTSADVDRAVAAAKAALPVWNALKPAERGRARRPRGRRQDGLTGRGRAGSVFWGIRTATL